MPEEADLDVMSMQIAGVPYNQVTFPEHRARIMELALQAHANYQREDIVEHLKSLAEHAKNIDEHLDDVRDEIQHIGSWFQHSKLWEGRLT